MSTETRAPTAREALLSLAAEFERLAGEARSPDYGSAYATAAGMAQSRAESLPAAANGDAPVSLDGQGGDEAEEAAQDDGEDLPPGQWLAIAFMGRTEYEGAYVRRVTRNGQAAYRVELPDYVWGGDPYAVRYHAAASWFGDWPVREESVRKAWEAKRAAAERRRRQQAEWERAQAERALPAGDEDDEDDLERQPF